jgi:MATE family multidrug resistance protein
LAFILDGYYLGLAAGATLRNAALLATVLGFAPLACLAWYYQSNTLLWLSMTTFMAARMISLGVQIPHTLKE